uniref:G-patch domain-containing protein n=1 Tax=Coccolithus braarudii TaxID=221442 RepID=A0A7S0LJ04_9EUKA
MMAKMGWEQGKGLGKREDGVTTHVKVKQRVDGLGLGADDVASQTSTWAPPSDLVPPRQRERQKGKQKRVEEEAVATKGRKGKKRKVEEGEGAAASASSSGVVPGLSDEQLFQLCGGARLGMRARGSQSGKQQRMADADAAFLAKYGGGSSTEAARSTPSMEEVAAQRRKETEKAAAAKRTQPLNTAVKGGEQDVDAKTARKAARKAGRKAEKKAARKAEKRQAREAARSTECLA